MIFCDYPLSIILTNPLSAVLPGRSDNDVKNRWHSKMRSQKYKRANALEASVDATPAQGKKRAKLKSSNVNSAMPKVGQRVHVKSIKDGLYGGGTITEVFKRVQTSHRDLAYKLTICNDDGAYYFPSLSSSLSFTPQTNLLECVNRGARRSGVSKFRCSIDPHKSQTVCE